jgi:hypothetical protein
VGEHHPPAAGEGGRIAGKDLEHRAGGLRGKSAAGNPSLGARAIPGGFKKMKGANQIPPGVEVRALLKLSPARRIGGIDLPPEVESTG